MFVKHERIGLNFSQFQPSVLGAVRDLFLKTGCKRLVERPWFECLAAAKLSIQELTVGTNIPDPFWTLPIPLNDSCFKFLMQDQNLAIEMFTNWTKEQSSEWAQSVFFD